MNTELLEAALRNAVLHARQCDKEYAYIRDDLYFAEISCEEAWEEVERYKAMFSKSEYQLFEDEDNGQEL